jgi:uncharacterized membrane protein
MFWGAEGAGASWPGGDAALLVIIPGLALVSVGMVAWLRSVRVEPAAEREASAGAGAAAGEMT